MSSPRIVLSPAWIMAAMLTIIPSVRPLDACADPEAPAPANAGIGVFTAVQGNVFTARAGLLHPLPAGPYQPLHLRDVIETEPRSRAKALLQDDTLLTIGEDSRVEISAYDHSAEQDHRRLVVRLVRGQARLLVGRAFSGSGSTVELHTPTALAASHKGYFVVGLTDAASGSAEGVTTVVNLGAVGTVNFHSGGQNVVLDPGQRSVAQARGAPTAPALVLIATDRTATAISKMLQNTELKDQVMPQTARQAWLANGADAVVPSVAKPQPVARDQESSNSSASQTRMTPPAVISGAVTTESPSPPAAVAVQGTVGTPAPQVTPPSNQLPPTLPPINSGGRGGGGKGKD